MRMGEGDANLNEKSETESVGTKGGGKKIKKVWERGKERQSKNGSRTAEMSQTRPKAERCGKWGGEGRGGGWGRRRCVLAIMAMRVSHRRTNGTNWSNL